MDTISLSTCSMTPSDWISIAEILITAAVGIWIGLSVQKQLVTDRAVKDYFIGECDKINDTYCHFFNSLYAGKLSSKYITEWLKIMSSRINVYSQFLSDEYEIEGDLLAIHNRIKRFITFTNEFNDSYSKDSMKLLPSSQNDVIRLHTDFKFAITSIIIDINKARKSNFPSFKKSK